MRDRESLCSILENIISSEYEPVSSMFKSEIIDTGKMNNSTIQGILSGSIKIDTLEVSALIWIYSAIRKYKIELPDIKKYFEDVEIKKASLEKEKTIQSRYPLIFDAIQLRQKDQYSMILSIKEINELQVAGIIQVDSNMQRESEIVVYNGQLISHVAYNDTKARDIAKLLVEREYWSDAIRWNLIKDDVADYTYDPESKKLMIKKGTVVLLDGQHRTRAMEYALIQDPSLEYDFPVIISIATVKEAQNIIAQHEKLQPINKNLIKVYQKSDANDIVRKLEINDDISKIYKFVNTPQGISSKAGFVLSGDIVDAIKEYYSVSKISLKEKNELSNWLIEFFTEIIYEMEDDFKNFRTLDSNRWTTNRFVFPAYVWLSSELRGKENWKDILRDLFNKIDFNKKPWMVGQAKPDKIIIKTFKEVLK